MGAIALGAAACARLPTPPEQRVGGAGEGLAGSGAGGSGGAGGAAVEVSLTAYPPAPSGRALRVSQFELTASGGRLDPATVVLARGEVSDVALRGLAKGAPPKSLLERAVPALVVASEGGSVVVAPSAPLDEGLYTLAAGSALWRQSLEVAAGEGVPLAARTWPPAAGGSAAFGVYCLQGGGPLPAEVRAGPAPALGSFEVRRGAVDDARFEACVTLFVTGAPGDAVPPPPQLVAGGRPVVSLDPAPLTPGVGPPPAPAAAGCAPPSQALGPVCCEVLDDRVVLRPGPSPVLGLVEAGPALAAQAFVDAPAVLRGLAPGAPVRVGAQFFDVAGRRVEASLETVAAAARPHVVLNEVLADALGPEPASEWVELVNDGATEVDLAGWRLADGGGEVVLPTHRLAPGAFVLLTAEGFEPGAGGDVAPGPGAARLTLPSLGTAGLSNGGEALALLAPGGEVVSRFPATPKPRPGASVARRRPDTPDDDRGGFVLSAPGASTPGAANGVAGQ